MFSLQKVIVIIVGSMLIAMGIDFFLMPIKVLDGGLIGIALIGNYLFGLKVGLLLILCSSPVFIYTWFKDKTFFFHSLFGMIFLSYFIDLFDPYNPLGSLVSQYPFIASIVGGLFIGIGFGILLRFDTSTGGIDLLAKLLAGKLRINVGILILLMDAIVVSMGGLLFSVDTFFLSVATISSGGLATSLCTTKYFSY
ncbi:YitT family protein [Cohnella cholangitidis]|uniref:YitT family protein n=1 Tax=Cohnella cholangitidis TaxID=2598458 RepID=A0A7G5BX92_9BACL|nr:YitT family protein [Cohnella cholangitidis]QMV41576.1 YitT family protein [Cohnella cholangitidis]